MKKSSVISITPRQIKACAALAILAQGFMPKGKRFGLFVWGDSGFGKNHMTDGIANLMQALTGEAYGHIDFNCASRMPEDVNGLPYIKKSEQGDATTKFAPIYNYNEKAGKGIFRLDEMDRPLIPAIIPAVLKYAIDRTDDNVLPENWFVLGQGNGCSDQGTNQLTNHTCGRFVHVYVSMNSESAKRDYETYLSESDADPAIQALHRLSPCESDDCFSEHARDCPRTMEYASCILKAYRTFGDKLREVGCPVDSVLRPLLAGTLGVDKASEIIRLMDFDNLPTLGQITNKPNDVEVPTDLSLSVKYVNAMIDFIACAHEAKQFATYLKRFPDEITRVGMEKLAALWTL